MRAPRDWSIRDKVAGLFVAMACIAAITVSVPMGVFDLLGLRRALHPRIHRRAGRPSPQPTYADAQG